MVRRAGVSLVEVLIAIAIIVILAALLLPVCQRARAQAQRSACATNLRQLGVAAKVYLIDHEEAAPPDATAEGGPGWDTALRPNLTNDEILRCPATPAGWTCPWTGRPLTYGFDVMLGPILGMSDRWYEEARGKYYPCAADAGEERIILVADARTSGISHFPPDLLLIGYANAPDPEFGPRGVHPREAWRRHPGGSNVCFLDGHVKVLSHDQLLAWVPVAGRRPAGP